MDQGKYITVEVAYLSEKKQALYIVHVREGATILDVIQKSGILEVFPEINLEQQKVGIYSEKKSLEDLVEEGDRVEIYRPLKIDPKEARRAKVKKKLPKNKRDKT